MVTTVIGVSTVLNTPPPVMVMRSPVARLCAAALTACALFAEGDTIVYWYSQAELSADVRLALELL